MAYVDPNYPTKKALKEAVAAGKDVFVFSPGPFGAKQDGTEYIEGPHYPKPGPFGDGTEYIEGPHYPKPHSWYAQVTVVNGKVIKVK